MAKFYKAIDNDTEAQYMFKCPGCGHAVRYRGLHQPTWTVSGVDADKPTVSPSILCTGYIRCHSFVKDGKIQFLNDCDHSLAGQTADLPDFD